MTKKILSNLISAVLILILCNSAVLAADGKLAFIGARLIYGTGAPAVENGVLIVTDGRISAVGPRSSISIPADAEIIDVSGKTLMPGMINAHGHVGGTLGLDSGHYNRENLLRQLKLYAQYGITTINSLGGDEDAGFQLRDSQDTNNLDRSRLYVAGAVVSASTTESAIAAVDANADLNADYIKIRVDDNLGRSSKMSPEVYKTIADQTHSRGLRLAVHLYYLEDAKKVLRAGADFIAHSVRDTQIDKELVSLLLEKDVCYSPTLTREISTFIYESRPDFFSDPFFLKAVDQSILTELQSPERQERMRQSTSAQQYKIGLQVALKNLKTLSDAGVKIAMGTDTGPAARFQGYFEHMELDLMVEAGLSPAEAIYSATGGAAHCLDLNDVGTLEPGNWADLVVLDANPLEDIANTKTINGVWVAGNKIE